MVPDPSNGNLTYQYAQTWSGPLPTHQHENNALQSTDFYPHSAGNSSYGSPQHALDASPSPYANTAVAGSFAATPGFTT